MAADIWKIVNGAYARLYPSRSLNMPAMQIGGVGLRDQFYLTRVSLGYGTCNIVPIDCIEAPRQELDIIWTTHPGQIWQAIYAVTDLFDFSYGADDLRQQNSRADTLWRNAASHIQAAAITLNSNFALEASVQSSCLAAELSMKGALAFLGYTDQQLQKISHHLGDAAKAICDQKPSARDAEFISAASTPNFPNYVGSRYNDHGLSRVELNALAMRAQFIAGEALRRVSTRDLESAIRNSPDAAPRVLP